MNVLIIGGGAAGLMAATTAASCNACVTVVEKNSRPARKLLITGKGRCNVTNDCDNTAVMENVPCNPRFLYSALNGFSSADVKRYFQNLGVPLKTERGNRVFPVSDKAADIVDALVNDCKNKGVSFYNGTVCEVLTQNGSAVGVKLTNGNTLLADRVIIATGGASYPATGSTGDGYIFAEKTGHTVTKIRPSLVPLEIKENFCGKMMGLSLKNVKLELYKKGIKKPLFSELGEMLFTHFGVTGPLVLSASAHIRGTDFENYILKLDLKPALSRETLDKRILRDFSNEPNKAYKNSLNALLPAKLIPTVVSLSKINGDTKVNQITKEQRARLIDVLKEISLSVSGFRPIEEAIITSGGVSVKEIDPKTMQSKIINGLYFAGEVIDVDAYTGGFNLQIAFSTGRLAGINAAKEV